MISLFGCCPLLKKNLMYNSKFDLDLEFGQVYEEGLKKLLYSKGKVEVKTERDKWIETGNIAIEVMCRNKPSGLSVTKSDWWFHILSLDKKVKGMICLPVKELKNICKYLLKEKKIKMVMGGDDEQSKLLLIPIKLLMGSVGKIF